jgi:molybdate transport system substrate-binding protein
MTNIAGVEIGLAVREGAPKPDISSVEALKHTLLSAQSIGYVDPALGSSSGKYVAGLIARLGLAEALMPKLRLTRSNDNVEDVFQGVAKGEIEMQMGQITEIVLSPGVELVGPLPAEIQNITLLAGGIVTTSKAPEAAKALIKFISSPAAAAVLKAKGFTPE